MGSSVVMLAWSVSEPLAIALRTKLVFHHKVSHSQAPRKRTSWNTILLSIDIGVKFYKAAWLEPPPLNFLKSKAFLLLSLHFLSDTNFAMLTSYHKAVLHSVTNNKMTLINIHDNQTISLIKTEQQKMESVTAVDECVRIFTTLPSYTIHIVRSVVCLSVICVCLSACISPLPRPHPTASILVPLALDVAPQTWKPNSAHALIDQFL